MSFADFTHPDDVAATDVARGEVLDGKSLVDFVNRFRKSDGSYLWILWTASTDPRDRADVCGRQGRDRAQADEAGVDRQSLR